MLINVIRYKDEYVEKYELWLGNEGKKGVKLNTIHTLSTNVSFRFFERSIELIIHSGTEFISKSFDIEQIKLLENQEGLYLLFTNKGDDLLDKDELDMGEIVLPGKVEVYLLEGQIAKIFISHRLFETFKIENNSNVIISYKTIV